MRKRTQEADTKMTQLLELPDREFKAIIIKMLQEALIETPITNEKQKVTPKKQKILKKNWGIEK